MKWIAVIRETNEIIAAEEGFLACCEAAEATGIWDHKPGSCAPYFLTGAHSKDFFRAWYPKGFWSGVNRRTPCQNSKN